MKELIDKMRKELDNEWKKINITVKEQADIKNVAEIGKTDEWYTPQEILDYIKEKMWRVDTDPCSNGKSNIGFRYNYTKDDNGLEQPWYGSCFVNAPYSKNKEFVDKAIMELSNGNAIVVAYLCFNSTETEWFRKLAQSKHCFEIEFLSERVRFIDKEGNKQVTPPKGSCIIWLSDIKRELDEQVVVKYKSFKGGNK